MKTGLRNISYSIIIFTSIYTFFASMILGINLTYNYNIVISLLNVKNIYSNDYSLLGNYAWNVVIPYGIGSYTISFQWLHLFFSYIIFPIYYSISFLIAVGYFIAITFSIVTLPFSALPIQVSQFFSALFVILFIISIITSIQILATSIKGDE